MFDQAGIAVTVVAPAGAKTAGARSMMSVS
jgi:hypothetical protein